MRFAYIDSQGNEVSIPSVDALALRIELGAISEETELYDAQADRWGPAHTHEIFHTLSRGTGDDEGLMAPPPVVPPPPGLGDEPEEPEAEEAEEAPGFDVEGGLELEAEDEEEIGSGFDADDFGLSLADAPAPAAAEPEEEEQEDSGFGDFGGFDLAPAAGAEPSLAPEPEEDDEDEEEDGGFDFGDFDGGLELDTPEPAEEPAAASMDFGVGDDMGLETPMDFAGGGDMGGGIELEQPMSEFTPDAPPAWMEQDGPGGDDDGAMSFESPTEEPEAPARRPAAARADDDEDEAPRERPQPRSRPSPPRRPKKSPIGAIIGGVLGVAVLGGGGYFAFTMFASGGGQEEEAPALPPVVIPEIPAELLPQMRDLAEAAIAQMLADLTARSEALEIPTEPREDWLGGNYLANASQYQDIERFWLGIERFVDEVRTTDAQLFHENYLLQLEAAEVDAETGALMTERADSGFVAARDGRFAAYNLMDDLVNASLDMHQFLLDNEDNIEYQPAAAGLSADPVLEAVPSTPELEEEMLTRVTEITRALADLGTLDRVTRERLFAVLFDRIRRAGIE